MRAKDARYAADMAEVLSDVRAVRAGLKAKLKVDGVMTMSIEAAEEVAGDPMAGYVHCSISVAPAVRVAILDAIERFARSELKRLKVTP